jgi:hypothetical protein
MDSALLLDTFPNFEHQIHLVEEEETGVVLGSAMRSSSSIVKVPTIIAEDMLSVFRRYCYYHFPFYF